MRRALAVAVVTALALSGCSATDEGTSADSAPTPSASGARMPETSPTDAGSPAPSPSEEQAGDDAVEVEIEGDRIEPNGRRLEVSVGEPVRLEIKSDRATELHVHSVPEQVIEVKEGKSTVDVAVETPGLVDVEEHGSGIVILQLEVR